MTPRRPISSTVSRATLPTLAALVASSSLPACQSPTCSDSRAGELRTHGKNSTRDLSHAELSHGLNELGVALGLAEHPRMAGGAPPAVTSLPPNTAATVTPVVPVVSNPSEAQIRPPGGAMRVQAHEIAMQHPTPTARHRRR